MDGYKLYLIHPISDKITIVPTGLLLAGITGLNLARRWIYRLAQQVACQRHRQTTIDAKDFAHSVAAGIRNAFRPQFAPALA